MIKFILSKKPAFFLIMALVLFVGVDSYNKSLKEDIPQLDIPYIVVSTDYAGATPKIVQDLITVPLENSIKSVEGIKDMQSYSREGSSTIELEFNSGVDIDEALDDITTKVDATKRDLPSDLDSDPGVFKITTSDFPVMSMNVFGNHSISELTDVVEDLESSFSQLQDFDSLEVRGGTEAEIQILLDPKNMERYGASLGLIISKISSANTQLPSGTVKMNNKEYSINIPTELKSIEELRDLEIIKFGGESIYLRDIGEVERKEKELASIARFNKQENINVDVIKTSEGNVLRLSEGIRAAINEYNFPEGVEYRIYNDGADSVNENIKTVTNGVFSAVVLVIIILLLFLGWRNALFVGTCIPLSLLISISIMKLLGITINSISTIGIIVSLGLLVDNAVVVVENCYRHISQGISRHKAIIKAVNQVALPVFVSALTTIAAFIPMLFQPGIMGQFVSFIPKVLIIVLGSSFFVAVVFNPLFCGTFMKAGKKSSIKVPFLSDLYNKMLDWAFQHKFKTILIAIVGSFVIIFAGAVLNKGVDMFPISAPTEAQLSLRGPEGVTIEDVDSILLQLTQISEKEEVIGNISSRAFGEQGRMNLYFLGDDIEGSNKVVKGLRDYVAKIPGFKTTIREESFGPPTSNFPISIRIFNEDLELFDTLIPEIEATLAGVDGLVEVQNDFTQSTPELRVDIDRNKAGLLNVDMASASIAVTAALSDYKVGYLRTGDEKIDITALYPDDYVEDFSSIMSILIPTTVGGSVPLSSIAEVGLASGYGTLKRADTKTVVTINSNLDGRTVAEVQPELDKVMLSFQDKYDFTYSFVGDTELLDEMIEFFRIALVIAFLLIFIVLLFQFGSFKLTLIILLSVPVAIIGVFFELAVMRSPFYVLVTGLGMIALVGIAVNNSIVLLSYINYLRRKGASLSEAIKEGARTRFRPVFLTTSTTIIGLIPLAIGLSFDLGTLRFVFNGDSADFWQPMAATIIFGLMISFLFTLILAPILYYYAERRGEAKKLSVKIKGV